MREVKIITSTGSLLIYLAGLLASYIQPRNLVSMVSLVYYFCHWGIVAFNSCYPNAGDRASLWPVEICTLFGVLTAGGV